MRHPGEVDALPDAELVDRARRGDRDAVAALVRRCQDDVYNLVFRMCRNSDDARDLAQTALLRALESLSQFERRSAFRTWVYRIAVNVVLSDRRRQSLRRRAFDPTPRGDSEIAPPTRPESGPEALTEHAELCERLAGALRELEPEYRAAVVLVDIEGLDYAEVADMLDLPVGTVKSRVHRGRAALRAALAEKGARRDA